MSREKKKKTANLYTVEWKAFMSPTCLQEILIAGCVNALFYRLHCIVERLIVFYDMYP